MPLTNPTSGTELGYAEITSNPSNFSTEADIAGVTITFTVGSRPVMCHVHVPYVQQNTSAGVFLVLMKDGSNVNQAQSGADVLATKFFGPCDVYKRFPAGTGALTMKARCSTSAGTVTVHADNGPTFIRAWEM